VDSVVLPETLPFRMKFPVTDDWARGADFLPGSHQYLLTVANAFWSVGLITANGMGFVFWTHLPARRLLIPRLPGVLFQSMPVAQPPFVRDPKTWDGAITASRPVDWIYSSGRCVSRCHFWRAQGTLLGKAEMRRPLGLCRRSQESMGGVPTWLLSNFWLWNVNIRSRARSVVRTKGFEVYLGCSVPSQGFVWDT